MKLNLGKTVLRINISFAAAVTLTLIIDESGLCAAGLFCCIIHELGHIICLLIMGEKPKIIELSFYGIRLERYGVKFENFIKEILVYSSGPAVNLILSAMFFAFGNSDGMKTAGAINLFIGLFNLIPCQCLDGGNILNSALKKFTDEEKCDKISFIVSCITLAPMTAAGIVIFLETGNVTLISVAAYLGIMCYFDKMKDKQ